MHLHVYLIIVFIFLYSESTEENKERDNKETGVSFQWEKNYVLESHVYY